jgi:hypothetical protein
MVQRHLGSGEGEVGVLGLLEVPPVARGEAGTNLACHRE